MRVARRILLLVLMSLVASAALPFALPARAAWAQSHEDDEDEDGPPSKPSQEKEEDEDEDEKPSLPKLDKKAIVALVKKKVEQAREKALSKVRERIDEKHAKRINLLATILFVLSFFGLLLLLSPVVLGKKYPGKEKVLLKYGAIAAVSWFVVVNLFALVLIVFKSVQHAIGAATHPELKIVEAAIDTLIDNAEHLAAVGPKLILPTLAKMREGGDDPLPVLLLDNVRKLGKDYEAFKRVIGIFRGLTWLLDVVPLLLTGVALLIFTAAAKPVLVQTVQMPARAAAGEEGVGRQILKATVVRLGRELLATLVLILTLIGITMVTSTVLTWVIRPAVEAFIGFLLVDIVYVQTVQDASSTLIIWSLASTVIFLALNVAIVVLTSAFFLGKLHGIFQTRFQEKKPLSTHRQFWKFGVPSFFWLCFLPLVYMFGARIALGIVAATALDSSSPSWTFALSSGPLVLVVGFLVFMTVLGGWPLKYLATYQPPKDQSSIGA